MKINLEKQRISISVHVLSVSVIYVNSYTDILVLMFYLSIFLQKKSVFVDKEIETYQI